MTHPAALPVDELLTACEERRTRRSGPGGQHRNKVETAVVLTHRPTGTVGQGSERRSQKLNRQAAILRLRVRLALDVRRPVAADETLSPLWRARLRSRQMSVSDEHDDFPALLAEALDRLAACDWDVAAASERLGITASQLIKLMKQAPEALTMLNRQRVVHGLKSLR